MNIDNIRYKQVEGGLSSFITIATVLGIVLAIAMGAVYYMEHSGHYVTGMNNRIVWGAPHVFAIFLIVAASGALNIASISSVFNKKFYKPLARFSVVLALTLLAGGLMILVLDLGRPDRLIVAMTEYNFKSIFAWNIILYNGFFAVVIVYLWMMLERKMNKYTKVAGTAAFIWRLILTTGTGSIFGFLVARQAYDAVIMAPMFVIMSFAFGLAVYILMLILSYNTSGRELGDSITTRLGNLLGVFIAAVFYFVLVYHLGNSYLAENHGVEEFILLGDNSYSSIFWYGQIILGTLLPLALLYCPRTRGKNVSIILASILTIIGGIAALYVIIIGGQAYPMEMFVGKEIISGYGGVVEYSPSLAEILLGLGGFALVVIATMFVTRVLPILPESLNNKLFAK
jgi:molybdopterin-containing oxidoreductase family membrane subunit